MARSTLGFGSLPALSLALACATAVDQGFEDDQTPGSGGSLLSQGGSPSSGGKASGGGGKVSGTGGTATNAFGGSSTSGSGGTPDDGDAGSAGMPSSGSSGSSSGGNAGTDSGGNAGAASGGKSSGGAGGTSSAGGGAGGTTASGGSGGSTSSTGDCAPNDSGWVVQYWTNTPPANMPAGDMRIFNNNGGTTNFTSLELRHYFTNEETANLSFTFSTFGHNFPGMPYYEDEGGGNVQSAILAVAPPVTNASSYIRIKFNATPGTFGNNEWVQLGFYGSLSMYPLKSNQANDYTYAGHAMNDPGSANKNVGWDHITLYKDGELVWGCEP